MNNCYRTISKARTVVLRQSCCLRGHRTHPLWVFGARWSCRRAASSQSAIKTAEDAIQGTNYGSSFSANASRRKRDDLISKEVVLDVLSSTATKREAKSYLSRFRSEKPKNVQAKPQRIQKPDVGVNLGNLYLPVRAIDQSPVFLQGHNKAQFANEISGPLHTALVKIRDPETIGESTLRHVALTLVQLSRLGMSSVVVVDCGSTEEANNPDLRKIARAQMNRVAAALEHHDVQGARRLDTVLAISGIDRGFHSSVKVRSGTFVTNRNFLLTPLRKGKIPVIAPIAFASTSQTLEYVPADEAILALTRDFAGLRPQLMPEADPQAVAKNVQSMQMEVSLDRIILLDPLGGIPAPDKDRQSHIFVNLEQEYEMIKWELSHQELNEAMVQEISSFAPKDAASQSLAYGNPVSKSWDSQSSFGNRQPAQSITSGDQRVVPVHHGIHLRNLALLRDTLAILPPSSSGLLTTPETAANSGQRPQDTSPAPGVGTRRQRNPLIHNLLTDKPVFSSSLPSNRTQQSTDSKGHSYPIAPSTFVKRGMPVTVIPDPQIHPWKPPSPSDPSIQLSDPRIDLPRLIHLIEDSFNRKLDVQHYLSRINNRIAGIIIAGEYEGGALMTWETPPHNPRSVVPYLDKFAVLKRSQGAGGVADIVFTAMVRTCFPEGVCWRSRKDNPVNKWYFERARGTWKIPESNWTMFWTTEGVQVGEGRGVFGDYEGVCRSVEPSWADVKAVVD